MKTLAGLLLCAVLIFGAWALNPGLGIVVAILCYWGLNGLLSKDP
jgi:hypothetical protein